MKTFKYVAVAAMMIAYCVFVVAMCMADERQRVENNRRAHGHDGGVSAIANDEALAWSPENWPSRHVDGGYCCGEQNQPCDPNWGKRKKPPQGKGEKAKPTKADASDGASGEMIAICLIDGWCLCECARYPDCAWLPLPFKCFYTQYHRPLGLLF